MASYSRILGSTTSALFLAAAFLTMGCGSEQLSEDNEDNQVGMGLPPVDADENAVPESNGLPLQRFRTPPPTTEELAADRAIVEQFQAEAKARSSEKQGSPPSSAVGNGTIIVYVHVINKGPTVADGNITDNKIYKQMVALNQAFNSKTGWAFYNSVTDRTTNPTWYTACPGSSAEIAMKTALHKGDASTLNLYITQCSLGFLGWSTRPEQYFNNPTMDGVVISNLTLPGGAAPFDQGKSAVHEVGRWLGLYNTFENGCANPGDSVSDTPASKSPTYGCPSSRDSCSSSGNDPIHNYMDFTDDACMWEFTPGQAARIDSMWTIYRN